MAEFRLQGRAIEIGYPWRLRLPFGGDVAMFPDGTALAMHVREKRSDTTPKATLTTENGGIVIVSPLEIEIVVPAAATASMRPGTVVADIVRTDPDPHEHLGVSMLIPVILPVTRGL